MSKYAALRDFLITRKHGHWSPTFSEIEKVLGFNLPVSARKYPAWWANQDRRSHVQCSGWLDAGWRTSNLSLETEQVTFQYVDGTPTETSPKDFKPTKSALTWGDVLGPKNAQPPIKLDIEVSWQHLGELFIDHKERIAFPRTPLGPAVYRFELKQSGCVEYYIGETEEISRRLQQYRTPGVTQRTNQRIKDLIVECLQKGGTVNVAIIPNGHALYDEGELKIDLADYHQRKLIEATAIFAALMNHQDVLNK